MQQAQRPSQNSSKKQPGKVAVKIQQVLWHGRVFRGASSLLPALMQDPWYRKILREWWRRTAWANGGHLLEMGCSSGDFSREVAQQGYWVSGVDRNKSLIAKAKKHAISKLNFQCGDVYDFDALPASYDGVFGASFLNVLPDPEAAVRRLSTLCKPGAWMSFLLPAPSMTTSAVWDYARSHQLNAASTALALTWARFARKIDPQLAQAWFAQVPHHELRVTPLGLLYGISARVGLAE